MKPVRPDRQAAPVGLDDHGKPFPLTGPLPSAGEQAASNERAIRALEKEEKEAESKGHPARPGTDKPEGPK